VFLLYLRIESASLTSNLKPQTSNTFMKPLLLLTYFILFSLAVSSQQKIEKRKLLYSDAFKKDLKNWIVEADERQGKAEVKVENGKLFIEAIGGVTIWFNKILSSNYMIEFKRKVVIDGGKYDRLSDLNMFWAATDPRNKNLFTRNGVLETYDSLQLYYVGMGGNTNKTTRFRKYQGNGERTLLKEYLDPQHLLQANKEYLVQIVVNNGTTEVFVDGEKFFTYADDDPLSKGYFGIRTTKSHQEVKAFKVYKIK
jgi:rhamnogalacturonan endolyase